MFFELENEKKFDQFRANGKTYNIHMLYPSKQFEKGYKKKDFNEYFRFLIVRDPIKRFLSCYSNRVVHYHNLAKWQLSPEAIAEGATPDPDLIGFIERLELYRKWSNHIRHHTDPAHLFTGPDLTWFDAIYRIEEMKECEEKLSQICGIPINIPHEQTGGPRFHMEELPRSSLLKIIDFYKGDYELFSQFYDAPKLS